MWSHDSLASRSFERETVALALQARVPSMIEILLDRADRCGKRTVRSVANLTRQDAREFLALAPAVSIKTHVEPYALTDANRALLNLRSGRIKGAAVLVM